MSLSSVQYLEGRVLIQLGSYICLAIRKTAQEVSWPSCRRRRVGSSKRRAFSRSRLSALGSLGTARWDHHGDRRPHTFIPRDVSPWSYASLLRPCPASLIPNFLLYDRPSVRSFHPGLRRSSDWARSHLPSEDPRRSPARIFGRRDTRKRRLTALASPSFSVSRLSACFLYAPQYFARSFRFTLYERFYSLRRNLLDRNKKD